MVLLNIIHPHAQTKNFSPPFCFYSINEFWIYLESDIHSIPIPWLAPKAPLPSFLLQGMISLLLLLSVSMSTTTKEKTGGEGSLKYSDSNPSYLGTLHDRAGTLPHFQLHLLPPFPLATWPSFWFWTHQAHPNIVTFQGYSCLKCRTLRFLLTDSFLSRKPQLKFYLLWLPNLKFPTSLPRFTNIFLQCSYMKLSYLLVFRLSVFPPPENTCSTTTGTISIGSLLCILSDWNREYLALKVNECSQIQRTLSSNSLYWDSVWLHIKFHFSCFMDVYMHMCVYIDKIQIYRQHNIDKR